MLVRLQIIATTAHTFPKQLWNHALLRCQQLRFQLFYIFWHGAPESYLPTAAFEPVVRKEHFMPGSSCFRV